MIEVLPCLVLHIHRVCTYAVDAFDLDREMR